MRRSDSGSWASGLRTHRMVMRPWRMLHPCLTMLLLALYRSRRQGGKELIRLQTRTSLSTTTGFDPRAVRAASGHSMSFTPDKMLMRVDRTSSRNILRCHWLIYPQMVIPQLKLSQSPIVENGILRGMEVADSSSREIAQSFWRRRSSGQTQPGHEVRERAHAFGGSLHPNS